MAWARPISAPSLVTTEFSDMFCALNGATLTPRRASQRQIPAVTALLPASDAVPATSNPFMRPSWRPATRSCGRPGGQQPVHGSLAPVLATRTPFTASRRHPGDWQPLQSAPAAPS